MGVTNERLTELAKAAQDICVKLCAPFHCDAADAMESKLRLLYPDNPPKEGQVVITISPAGELRFAPFELVKELEKLPAVWRVYQTESPLHGLS